MGDGNGRNAWAERGQGLVEYALIIFLVAIVVIAILLLLGPQIGLVFNSIYATI
jgi:pilus assembly protein Flp/PilA